MSYEGSILTRLLTFDDLRLVEIMHHSLEALMQIVDGDDLRPVLVYQSSFGFRISPLELLEDVTLSTANVDKKYLIRTFSRASNEALADSVEHWINPQRSIRTEGLHHTGKLSCDDGMLREVLKYVSVFQIVRQGKGAVFRIRWRFPVMLCEPRWSFDIDW